MASSWSGMMAAEMGWTAMDDGWRKGPWTAEEDRLIVDYVKHHGEGRWNSVSRLTGLRRNGKSCRLRWVNYLRPDLKRGQITPQEEQVILELHARWGNRWSTIARSLPGRTDNEIKNYWRTHFKKKAKTSGDNTEKLRARLLKRQQFQQQQQQQQQQQEHQFSQLDTKKIMSFLELNDNRVFPTSFLAQMAPTTDVIATATTIMYPNNNMNGEEQGVFYSMPNSDTSKSEGSSDYQSQNQQHDMFWDDGLWSFEDVQGNLNGLCATSKQASFVAHFVSPFY
ncbi:hypothetical protein V2J09_023263 [Rumex salicifolius]